MNPVRRILVASGCALALTACSAVDEAMESLTGLLPGEAGDEPEVVEEVASPSEGDASDGDGGAEGEGNSAGDAQGGVGDGSEGGEASADDAAGGLDVTPVRDVAGAEVSEPIRVAYEITGPMATMMDEMVVSLDVGRQSVSASGADGAMYWAQTDGDLIVCFDEGAWECLAMPFGEHEMLGTGALFGAHLYDGIPDLEDAHTEVRDVHDETVAGRAATCLTVEEAGGTGEFCLDDATGILLRGAVTEAGTSFSITAVEVAAPTDADFVPPADPVDLEQLLGD